MPELKLSVGMYGDDVKLLHSKLRRHGFDIPKTEIDRGFFGPTTREAVLECQKEHGLKATGMVDQRTHAAIDEALAARKGQPAAMGAGADGQPSTSARPPTSEPPAASGPQSGEEQFAVRRQVVKPDGSPVGIIFPLSAGMSGTSIADLQDVLHLFLNQAVILPNDEGARRELSEQLARERINQRFGQATENLVRVFQEEHKVEISGVVDESTADVLNALLRELGPVSVVRGRIVSHELRGLPGLRVVAVDKNVGEDVSLGEGASGDRGAYEISYSLARLEKQKPDVQVQVTDDNGGTLAASPVRYNAGPDESDLDIVIPAEKLPQPAEYRGLIDELGAQLGAKDEPQLKQQLAALKEDDLQQDITYLANKTGWDARMVAMTSLASQFEERSGVEAEFYYALFRAGVPANEAVLSQLAPETVRQAWERAVEQRMLPPELKEKIPASLERFRVHSAGRLLEEPAQIGVSSFKELIEGALVGEADQQRFAELYYEQRGDLDGFWRSVRAEFPKEVDRLQLNGKLGFLTVNNAPLIQRLHAQNGGLSTPLDLVRRGLYRSDAWEALLVDGVDVPDETPGEKPEEKKANYAAFLASHLRLSYPTAVVAEMVRADKPAVAHFLDEHQDKFELGIHPVEQYLHKNNIALEEPVEPVLAEIKKLQRVYQISPSDEAMGELMESDLDSAYAVVQYDEQTFTNEFRDKLGGEAMARLTYAKAHQVHHAVLNIATAYLLEKSSPSLHATQSLPAVNGADGTGLIAYPTLERMFGEMDYCTCEDCRSWLSPAAYLVDLLLFLDPPAHEKDKPLDALLARRPDIQHLQLTCENTNTVLPYIDLVNEVLEHYVVNGSLDAFTGHNIEEGVATEELLANPEFVNDAAYTNLRDSVFPPPLPFHQPLEALRRYFERFEVPLHEAMERLRQNNELERAGGIADPAYGWRDVLMERLQLSRPEHAVLTDSGTPLQTLYGEDPDVITVVELVDRLSNAKTFARRLDLTYEELIESVRTQFINPHSHLIPKLEKLGVNFKIIQDFLHGTLTEAEFRALLPIDDLDMTQYGGSAVQLEDQKFAQLEQWLQDNEAQIMGLIVLSDPTGSEDICGFDTVELRYALPDFANNKLRPVEFLKLLRFIRLWRKLGWTIEQTDKVIAALYPADQYPTPADDADTARIKLDTGFQSLILRLAHLQTVMAQLKLTPKDDLTALLACWSPIDTHGYHSLYRQMFLNPTILALDATFEEDGYGNYLAEKREYQQPGTKPPKLLAHAQALRAAFNLTQEEFDLIVEGLGLDDATVLDLANISAIFRHGYLARKLRLSMRELLALKAMSGLDPFLPLDLAQPPDPAQPLGAVRPPTTRFIELAQQIEASPLKVSQLLYFLQHDDLGGEASPSQEDVLAFARTLRSDLLRIDREHVVQEDPTGEIARTKMALVYGSEATDTFFGLLNNTSPFSVTSSFFDRYPDLKGLYEDFVDSDDPKEDKMSALLADFLPDLRARLKRQQVRQTVSAQTDADLTLVTPLLENASLLSVGQPAQSAIADFLALEMQGLSADIFFADDVTGIPDQPGVHANAIDYRDGGATLPANPAGGNATISGVWRGFLEAPDNGFYNFYVEADAGAEVGLTLDAEAVPLALNNGNGVWQNQDVIELDVGRLYALQITAKKVKAKLVLKWERKGMGRAPIPAAQFYPAVALAHFTTIYLRLLKALAIADALALSGDELDHFGAHADYSLKGKVEIFFADDVTGIPDQPGVHANAIDYRDGGATLPANPAGGNATISGVWRGFLEAPDNGFYNFYVEADAGAEVGLTLDAEAVPLALNNGVWQNQDATELRAGRLYELELIARRVKDVLVMKWERSSDALPGGVVLPISVAGWLNALPAAPASAGPTSQALLRNVLALIQYRVLKEELKIRDDGLLVLLQDPSATGEDGVPLLSRVTGWQEADRTALLAHFGLADGDMAHLGHFVRLHDASAVVKKLGVGAAALLEIVTNEPNVEGLRSLQGALRARYDNTPGLETTQPTSDTSSAKGAWPTSRDWFELIQPINDELRGLRRDALVAYVLHRLGQDNTTEHIDTPDKLFEYFLIDVQMDPCTKTSRIRQALSSVQLFVQRCLLNLEPQVASSSIEAKQWEWMNRYRMWEANRKVFLFPENWLEPELRDNKSPFFKDLENELLQSDITDDAAATALVHYLEKLDEVAKLEICGMYYEENEINEANDTLHVIARTAGARRTYYYRRQESGTAWTAWERVDLNIEDNPVLPVVWRGRLFLFWVSVLQEAPPQSTSSSGSDTALNLAEVKPSQLKEVVGEAKTQVTVNLYWSEYYHGKWQPARTSDVNRPLEIGEFPPSGEGAFDRASLRLRSWVPFEGFSPEFPGFTSGELSIGAVYSHSQRGYFNMYNTHSLPVSEISPITDVDFSEFHLNSLFNRIVLNKGPLYEIIASRHGGRSIFEGPFFFQDRRHVFFVESEVSKVRVGWYDDLGPSPTQGEVLAARSVRVQPDLPLPPDEFIFPPGLIKPGVAHPGLLETFLRQDRYVHQVMDTEGTIQFGDRLIGPGGSAASERNGR